MCGMPENDGCGARTLKSIVTEIIGHHGLHVWMKKSWSLRRMNRKSDTNSKSLVNLWLYFINVQSDKRPASQCTVHVMDYHSSS